MVNVYHRTKFEANIFINDRDMAKTPIFKMAAAAILNFGNGVIFGTNDTRRPIANVDLHTIWWKSVQKWPRYTRLRISKMAAVGHHGFILTPF